MGQQLVSGYAPVNGAGLYWESRGRGGTPLVLVHGGYGLTRTFDALADELAADRQVVALELRGHGHSADDQRPFGWDEFGDEIAAVIGHLGIGPADLLGYSLGGGASLRCAIRHPETVRRLVVVSAPFRRAAWFPEVIAGFDQMTASTLFPMLSQSPLYAQWAEVAPDPASFPVLIDKTGALLRQPYDWADDVRGLAGPVLLVYADADSIPPAHAAEFYSLLGGGRRDAGWDGSLAGPSRLAILPGRTHYNIIDAAPLAGLIAEFTAALPAVLGHRHRGPA
jgi:pimeloyl-ACP methyl ester carboxylesterase